MKSDLNKRFLKHIQKHWYCYNTYDRNQKNLSEKSGVYIFAHLDYRNKIMEIVYVGSSTNLFYRYKSHKVPHKIQKLSECSIPVLFFIEMEKGFYDYERKLISKLNPLFNKQHKSKN